MLRRDKSDRCCVRPVVCALGLVVVLLLSGLAGCGGDDDDDEADQVTLAGPPRDAGCGNRADFGSGPELTILGLTADQRLVRFQECRPRQVQGVGSVSGLQAPDTALVGIDFRVQDGQLYGVGNGGGVYTLNVTTAQATIVNALTVPLAGAFFGVDFNPAANALRIISDTGQNLRLPFAARSRARPRPIPRSITPARPGQSGHRPQWGRVYGQRSRPQHRDDPVQHRHGIEPGGHPVATQCGGARGDRPADRGSGHRGRVRHLHATTRGGGHRQ